MMCILCYGYFRQNCVKKSKENVVLSFTFQNSGVISSKYFHVKIYKNVEQHVKIATTYTFNYY